MAFRINDGGGNLSYEWTVKAGAHIRGALDDYEDDADHVPGDPNLLQGLHTELGLAGENVDIVHSDDNQSVYKAKGTDNKLKVKLRTCKDRGKKSYAIALPKEIGDGQYLVNILSKIAEKMACEDQGGGVHKVVLPEDGAGEDEKHLTDLKDFLLAIITMSKCR